MRKWSILAFLLTGITPVVAQNDLVNWSFTSTKISGNSYEIKIQATLRKGWHIYSQNPGEGPLPTSVSFMKSSLITLEGKLNEAGVLKSEQSDVFNSKISYYENKMILVQRIKLKVNVKTSFKGNVRYMICNNRQCLPPMSKPFTILITS